MNNITLAFEVLWKIAGNFIFNPTAGGIIIFFGLGLLAWSLMYKRDHNC